MREWSAADLGLAGDVARTVEVVSNLAPEQDRKQVERKRVLAE